MAAALSSGGSGIGGLLQAFGSCLLPSSPPTISTTETEASSENQYPKLTEAEINTVIDGIKEMRERSITHARISFTPSPKLEGISPTKEEIPLIKEFSLPSSVTRSRPPLFVKSGISEGELEKTMRAGELGIGAHIYLVRETPEGGFFWAMKEYDRDLYSLASDLSVPFETRLLIAAKFSQLIADCHANIGPHSDVKLDNAVYSEENTDVRLVDFQEGHDTFTMGYLSPERAFCFYSNTFPPLRVLEADDTYAATICTFELLTGCSLDDNYSDLPYSEETLAMLISMRKSHNTMVEVMKSGISQSKIVPEGWGPKIIDTLSGGLLRVSEERITSDTLAEKVSALWRDFSREKSLSGSVSASSTEARASS